MSDTRRAVACFLLASVTFTIAATVPEIAVAMGIATALLLFGVALLLLGYGAER